MSSTLHIRSFFETFVVIRKNGETIPRILEYRGEDGERDAKLDADKFSAMGYSVEIAKKRPLRFRGAFTS